MPQREEKETMNPIEEIESCVSSMRKSGRSQPDIIQFVRNSRVVVDINYDRQYYVILRRERQKLHDERNKGVHRADT